MVARPYRLALPAADRDRLPGGRLYLSQGAGAAEPALAEVRAAAVHGHEPAGSRPAVLYHHHADRPGDARLRQGFPAPAARPRRQELLDRAGAPRAAAAIHEEPVLKSG